MKKTNSLSKSELANWTNWIVYFYENDNLIAIVHYYLMDNLLGFEDKLSQAYSKAKNEYADFGNSQKDKLKINLCNSKFYPEYQEIEVANWSKSNGLVELIKK